MQVTSRQVVVVVVVVYFTYPLLMIVVFGGIEKQVHGDVCNDAAEDDATVLVSCRSAKLLLIMVETETIECFLKRTSAPAQSC